MFYKEHDEGIIAGLDVIIKRSKNIVARDVELYIEYVIDKVVSTGVGDVRGYYKALANEGLFGMAPEEIDV